VYQVFVRRRVQATFDALSRGDYTVALGGLADDVHHVFAGDHALGGERHSRDAVRRWFERVFRLYDELRFEVRRVTVAGPPWRLVASVEWLAHARPKAGEPYVNEGAHIIEIRRGKIVYLHAYEDSQKVAEALRRMAEGGIDEAGAAPIVDGAAGYVAERKGNPFVRSAAGGRTLSALQLPWFTALPPRGFGVITTTGRKTGKTRRKCVRAIRSGDKAYLVSIGGARAAWLMNIRANPDVYLRIRGGTFAGRARELADETETQEAMAAYCETVNPLDFVECTLHRRGRPTRSKIKQLHRTWFEKGIPLVVELSR